MDEVSSKWVLCGWKFQQHAYIVDISGMMSALWFRESAFVCTFYVEHCEWVLNVKSKASSRTKIIKKCYLMFNELQYVLHNFVKFVYCWFGRKGFPPQGSSLYVEVLCYIWQMGNCLCLQTIHPISCTEYLVKWLYNKLWKWYNYVKLWSRLLFDCIIHCVYLLYCLFLWCVVSYTCM